MIFKALVYLYEIIIQLGFLFFVTTVGNKIIKWGFAKIHEKKEDDENKLGRHIGNAERVLLCFAIINESWELVTAVIALKALSRFQKLDDKTFAEYFLIGSSWSLIYCLILSYIYKTYIGFFDSAKIEGLEKLLFIIFK